MVTIFKGKINLQNKFGISYTCVIIAVLILLNTYPLLVSQDLVFKSKETSLRSSVKLIEASLSGLDELTVENVSAALSSMTETGVNRLLVTDTAGRILYDSRKENGAVGKYAFYSEIAEALWGNDAFYCTYDEQAFFSRMAEPVVYHNEIVGAVYVYEYDTEQAELLKGFQQNLMTISLIVAISVLLLSYGLSRMLTRSISTLLTAIRNVREGAYSTRAEVRGNDEIAQIAAEFNSLTDRLATTENARRRFVSDASHEMKTPLAGIQLRSDSIMQTEDMNPKMIREFVSDIGQEAQRLNRITEHLLALTRLDSEFMPQVDENTATAVDTVCERVVRMLGVVAREKGVTLTCDCAEGAVVRATEDDVHQVLYNLMENGIKYSGNGGFVHTCATVEGDFIAITVEDNGIGIPEADRPHVFDRFYRVDKMRSRAVGGTGLGLSIAKDTVEYRGGSISVDGRGDNAGTVFTVRLPRAESEVAQ